MTNARDIMSGSPECASVSDSLVDAARKMRDLDVAPCRSAGRTIDWPGSSPTGTLSSSVWPTEGTRHR
jgi:hypothetical protein